MMLTADFKKTLQSVHSKAPCNLVMASAVQLITSNVLGMIYNQFIQIGQLANDGINANLGQFKKMMIITPKTNKTKF